MTEKSAVKLVLEKYVEKAKDLGLEVGEDALIKVVKELLFPMLSELAVATKTTVDDIAVPILGMLEPKLIEYIDKIYEEKES